MLRINYNLQNMYITAQRCKDGQTMDIFMYTPTYKKRSDNHKLWLKGNKEDRFYVGRTKEYS
jgi:hypothetical protein